MIREAALKDLAVIQSIYNEAILNTTVVFDIEPKTDAVMIRWFEAHKGYHKIFVYEENGETLGFAALSQYREHQAFAATVELSIYVEKAQRGAGIGRKLMTHTIAYAQQCDQIHTIVSVITSTNEGSIQFHLDFGFKSCGRIEDAGYKFCN
jgi:phosphinothricin acetyltransferase